MKFFLLLLIQVLNNNALGRGALNKRQLNYLEHYERRNKVKSGCCIVMWNVVDKTNLIAWWLHDHKLRIVFFFFFLDCVPFVSQDMIHLLLLSKLYFSFLSPLLLIRLLYNIYIILHIVVWYIIWYVWIVMICTVFIPLLQIIWFVGDKFPLTIDLEGQNLMIWLRIVITIPFILGKENNRGHTLSDKTSSTQLINREIRMNLCPWS